MKKIYLILIICSGLFDGCGSGYDSYVNNNIMPLSIKGIVVSKYEEKTGCFGAIVIQQKGIIDTIKNIFTCAPKDEKIWDYVLAGDSLYKKQNSLVITVVREYHRIEFVFPTRD